MGSGFRADPSVEAVANSPSKSLALALGAFCVGVALGPAWDAIGASVPIVIGITAILLNLFARSRTMIVISVALALFALGGVRTQGAPWTVALPDQASDVRELVAHEMAVALSEPHASFLTGLIFGGSSDLPDGLREAFRTTGTSHILSASGYNVSLFTFYFFNWVITTPLARRRGIWATAILLVVYALGAGASAAVLRATLMGAVILVGAAVRRRAKMGNALLLAVALMLLFDPTLLWGDVGFQLSVVATSAMIFWAPAFARRVAFLPKKFGIRDSFGGSIAAIIATTPIVLWWFGTVSLVAPLANLAVLPMVPYAMASGLIGLAATIYDPGIGQIISLPAWAFSSVILHVVSWLEALPLASVSVPFAHAAAAVSAAVIFFVWLRVRRA